MVLERKTGDRGGKAKPGPEHKALTRRILLVGDKPVFAALRQSLLRSGETKVLAAVSGSEGLRVAQTAPPDVILLDAELPDMEGFEVCRRLRVDPLTEAVPVIVLTGKSQPQWPQNTAETSAVASVPLGIDTSRLLNMIQMVLTTTLTRRTAPRATVELGVDYIHADTTGTGKTLNLSQDGMFVVTASPPEVGTHLIIHFALPDSEPLEGTGQVVWIRRPDADHPYPPGMAVQFLKLPPEARPAIAAFVAELLAPPAASTETT